MFKHFGLYFTEAHVEAARKGREREPLKQAWEQLGNIKHTDALPLILIGGFRYRFDDNTNAGMQAASLLDSLQLPADASFASLQTLVAAVQGYEMLRPLLSVQQQAHWQADFESHLSTLRKTQHYHEQVWRAALDLVGGVMLDKPELVEAGAEVFRRVVREDIRPDGYIQGVVEGAGGFFRHIVSTQALVLMAEAAQHAGIDLWSYEQRGVSVVTAAAYPLYYYYYPEKWRWDDSLTEDESQRILREHGGFLEIVNRHSPLHDIGMLLKEWRPVFDVCGGGLTTLSHAVPPRKGLFG